jgi:hypothetical protein
MATLQQRRAAQNETFFRDVNERATEARGDTNRSIVPTGPQQRFVCECSNDRCMETLLVDIDEYRAVRAHSDRFIVLAGHERDDIERVVDHRDGYLVVEKFDTAE